MDATVPPEDQIERVMTVLGLTRMAAIYHLRARRHIAQLTRFTGR